MTGTKVSLSAIEKMVGEMIEALPKGVDWWWWSARYFVPLEELV
jgi:hypothetical protein